MSLSWSGKRLTWLITGASSGFGLQLTRLALSHNHLVVATSRNPSSSPSLIAEITSNGGRLISLDIDDALAASNIVRDLNKEGLEIDVLVNCAGFSMHGPAESFSEGEVRAQMETVFFGPYRLMRALIPGMRERRRGIIVTLGSGAGVDGRPSMGIYGAAKAAMDGLLRIAAKELAPFNIRVLQVPLGGFDTNFAGRIITTATPFPEDYRGSMVEKVIESIGGGNFVPDGDHRKACQAIYEVIIGEGRGRGKEHHTVLPLGRDMWKLIDGVEDNAKRTREAFGELGNEVYLDK